jgi:hypothetical protein
LVSCVYWDPERSEISLDPNTETVDGSLQFRR